MRGLLSFIVLMAAVPVGAAWAETLALSYDIRKEAETIGREQVRISRHDGGETVEVATHTRAKVLFLDFRFDHTRREDWRDGRLVRMVADTDDDGAKTHVDATATEGGWSFVVNDRPSRRPGDSLPLTIWGKATLTKADLFSVVDAAPYRVQVAALGSENLTIAGKTVPAEHYRMTGGVERDLWYGADGMLLRTTFQRSGYPIEIVRIAP